MYNWIKTDTRDLATRRGKEIKPKQSHIMLSPYDVPNAVRAYCEDKLIIIEFKYINLKESTSAYDGDDDGITLHMGDKTKRIYKITIDPELMSGDTFSIFVHPEPVESAIDSYITHQENLSKQTAKYSATKSVLRDYADSLQKGFSQATACLG